MKTYDRQYYERWYRSRSAVITNALRERKVRLALAAAEFVLNRAVRSVLDIGCGEGAWRPVLKRLRPKLRYEGLDPSAYAVRRFGRRRNIRQAGFGELPTLQLRSSYDLVVCADVVMYVSAAELRRGLQRIGEVTRGVAYIEAYTTADDVEADFEGWLHRSEGEYRALFRSAGLIPCGLHCYVPARQKHLLAAMERCAATSR